MHKDHAKLDSKSTLTKPVNCIEQPNGWTSPEDSHIGPSHPHDWQGQGNFTHSLFFYLFKSSLFIFLIFPLQLKYREAFPSDTTRLDCLAGTRGTPCDSLEDLWSHLDWTKLATPPARFTHGQIIYSWLLILHQGYQIPLYIYIYIKKIIHFV